MGALIPVIDPEALDLYGSDESPVIIYKQCSAERIIDQLGHVFDIGDSPTDHSSTAAQVCPKDVKTEFSLQKQAMKSYTGLTDPLHGGSVGGFKLEKESPFVQRAASVIEDTLAYSPKFEYWHFATDGRFTAAAGIPTYGFSPCEEHLAHTADDHVSTDMMMDALYCYPQILL